jgi:hypothetical protein
MTSMKSQQLLGRNLILLALVAGCAREPEPRIIVPITPVAMKAEECVDLEWDQLAFEIDRNKEFEFSQLPPGVRDLIGKRVRIRGYMLPSFQARNFREFVIAGEIKQEPTKKRAGRQHPYWKLPAVDQLATVEMKNAPLANFTFKPLCIEGRLSFEIKEVDGEVACVFHIAADKAEVVEPREGYYSAAEHGC